MNRRRPFALFASACLTRACFTSTCFTCTCFTSACIVAAAAGCAAHDASVRALPAPLRDADVIRLATAGVADDEIIRRIEKTRSVYYLTSDDVVRLREAGLSDRVVTHMMATRAANSAAAARAAVPAGGWSGPRISVGGSVTR